MFSITKDIHKNHVVVMVWDKSLTCGINRWSCYEVECLVGVGGLWVVCGFGCLNGICFGL